MTSYEGPAMAMICIPGEVSRMLKYDLVPATRTRNTQGGGGTLHCLGIANRRNIFRDRAPSPFFPMQ